MTAPRRPMIHRRTFRLLAVIILLAIITINVAAFLHAHAMTHFANAGERTPRPEEMSLGQQFVVLFSGVNLPRPENHNTPADYQLSFETDTVVVDESIKLELWLIEHPNSRTTVAIFHGYGASKDDLLQEAAALYEMGCSVCLADFRGSGGSTGNETTIGWDEADDVEAVALFLRKRSPDQTLWLYGQSMGGAAVLRAASQIPTLADGLIIEAVYDRLLTTVKNRFEAMNVPATPFAHLLVFWGGMQHGFNAFNLNPCEYAKSVSIPTLMLHGERDERARVADAQAVYDNLGGVKQIEIFAGIGHQSCFNADAGKWRMLISRFLEKQNP